MGHIYLQLCAELVARILICTFLPAIVNGGAIDSSASVGAYVALCFGDPGAWILAIASLTYPAVRYQFGVNRKKQRDISL